MQSLCAYSLLNNFAERDPYEESVRQKQYFKIIPQDLPQTRGYGSFHGEVVSCTVLRVSDKFHSSEGRVGVLVISCPSMSLIRIRMWNQCLSRQAHLISTVRERVNKDMLSNRVMGEMEWL